MSLVPVLETERLILRAHKREDFETYAAMWRDPDVLRYTIREPRSPQDAWMTLQRMLGSWVLLGYGFWAVESRESGTFIGEAGFMQAMRPYIPEMHGIAELGYGFMPAAHGKGIASEALTAAHAWLDGTYPGTQSFALIDDENPASIRVAGKQGYRLDRYVDTGSGQAGLYMRSGPTISN